MVGKYGTSCKVAKQKGQKYRQNTYLAKSGIEINGQEADGMPLLPNSSLEDAGDPFLDLRLQERGRRLLEVALLLCQAARA